MAQSQTSDATIPSAAITWQTVNRVVYPTQDADLTLPLYAIEWTRPRTPASAINTEYATRNADLLSLSRAQLGEIVQAASSRDAAATDRESFSAPTRTRLEVRAGGHVSLCTYFNAFPASYWRYWTPVRSVRLQARVQGKGRITFFKSNSRGLSSPIASCAVDSPAPITITRVLSLAGTIDGGLIWFDAHADSHANLVIEDAVWQAPRADLRDAGTRRTTFSVTITTFNRERYALRQLKTLAASHDVRARLDTIYCVDQGTRPVSRQKGFGKVAEDLGLQLTYLRQANLGGSGGFSRGMYETASAGRSDYVLLLDDDAIIEPEAVLRALQFADYTRRPSIVGAGMLNLDDRTRLYTQAERMNMGNLLHEQYVENHDFASEPLRESPALHRRVDSQYNGWWMCLIPTTVIRKIGLALPAFIKFDDIDYCYRAAEHGYPTISLPGVAIWHQAWHSKDSTRSWQEYFEQRNRVLFALLHSAEPVRGLLRSVARHDSAMGLRFIYSGIALDNMAYKDVLRGPQAIVDGYRTAMSRVTALRSRFADAKTVPDAADIPLPRRAFTDPKQMPLDRRHVRRSSLHDIAHALLRPQNGRHEERPDIFVSTQDSTWQAYEHVNSALVAGPDSDSVSWLRRDDRAYRAGLITGVRLASRILRNWRSLRHAYLSADISSFATWKKIFAQAAEDAPGRS